MMDRISNNCIVITHGNWHHIQCSQVYHRNYPEIRGEGATLRAAANHLLAQLTRMLDFAHDPDDRAEIEQALADVKTAWAIRARQQPRRRDGKAAGEQPTFS
jgi:hypothetical protein